MLKLYYSAGACSLISHIVLEESGAHYQAQAISFAAGDQFADWFLAINPKARVPALVTDDGILTENPAIANYIAQTHPESDLLPEHDLLLANQILAFNVFMATSVHIAFRQISRPGDYADGDDAASALAKKVPELANEYFRVVEGQLADGREWVHGDAFSLSDPYLFVYANYLGMGDRGDWSLFPNLAAHHERMLGRPAVERVFADEGLSASVTEWFQ
tara:strand:- start:6337 stop:6990 length:654 start_codon:yes stop_codon:yes gene_type:complete